MCSMRLDKIVSDLHGSDIGSLEEDKSHSFREEKMMKRLIVFYSALVLFLFPAGSASIAGHIFFDDFDDYTGSIPWEGEGNWIVTEASVDLIGEGTSWDLLPGNGLYLDMDGSTNNAGTIESIGIELAPGDYVLSYDVAGNHRNCGDDSMYVLVGGGSLVNTTTTMGQDAPLTTVSIPFTVDDTTTATISFDGIGGDDEGLLLDNVGLATYDAMGTTIGESISFEVPFISQIDHRWANMIMLGQDQDGDSQTVDFNPEDVNYAECGSAFAAVSMVLEYYRGSTANWLDLSPVPPHVDDFLYQYGAHRSVAGGTGCSAVEIDMSPLVNWDKVDAPDSLMYSGIRLESQPWGIVSRMRLDADLQESRPHILEVDGPLSSDGTKTGWNTHYLVVAGWDEDQQSYLVHDPLMSSSEVYWDASSIIDDTLQVPAMSPTGAIYTEPQRTLHDLYYGKDPNVESGALNIITRVIFVEHTSVSEAARALKVYAAGPVELYASDPDGKRIGVDPVTGSGVQEADAYYYTQGGASPFNETCCNNLVKVIEFPRPKEGKYLIQVIGTEDGPLNLFFNTGDVTFEGQTGLGQINKYELEYSQDGISYVETTNFIPRAHAVSSTTSAGVGIPISFSGLTSCDFDGEIISYDWDFGDGTGATGAVVEHVYTAAGVFTAALMVEDDLGGTTTEEIKISIIEPATEKDPELPSVMIVRQQGDGSIVNLAPFLGLASTGPGNRAQVNFMALGIDPTYGQEEDWKWIWDFGDGSALVESSNWDGGVSGAAHEYVEPGIYTVTVIFNNGIEDSPPAAAQVEILPALARNGERFALDGSCYSAGDQIRANGRFAYTDVPELWDGGVALGEKPLEMWLNFYYEDNLHPLYYLLISEVSKDVPCDGWVLGGISPELLDLSFDYTFTLPDDLPDGKYEALFVAARDLYGSNTTWQDWASAELPLKIECPLMIEGVEVTSRRIPFVVSCTEPNNYLPVADAGGPYETTAGQPVTLDGTGSYDPDGDNETLKFKWFCPILDFTEPVNVPQPLEGPNPQVVFEEPGIYIVTLALEDEQGGVTYSTIGSPGSFAIVKVTEEAGNYPPIARAGNSQIIEQDSHAGGRVTLNGSSSYDPDGNPLTYTWLWDGGFVTGDAEVINVVLPLGTTTVTLVVNDGMADSYPDSVDITVQDTIVPVIHSITTTPSVLTPANWAMVAVTVNVNANDIGDPAPACYVTGVEGSTVGEQDWELTDDPLVVMLRARTIGCCQELAYTIHVACEDRAGNRTTGTVDITVPVSEDMVPPVIHSITATPSVLTPPNWSMVSVTVNVDASDERDPSPDCYITGVEATSGDEQDWELTGDPMVVRLRARTIGCCQEQVYTIHVACEDNSGNISTGTVTVTAPVP